MLVHSAVAHVATAGASPLGLSYRKAAAFLTCGVWLPRLDGIGAGPQTPGMGLFRHSRAIRLWIAAFYALAMVSAGFAHRALPAAYPGNGDLAAYALPDGSLPTFCLDGADQTTGGKTPQAASAVCDACVLTSAPGLEAATAPVCLTLPDAIAVRIATAVAEWRETRPGHVPHLRGPPLSLFAA